MSILNKIRINGESYDIADAANMAEEFSTSKAYSTGDYVIHPDTGILYRFTSDKAAGAWNASAVQQVKMANEVTQLKSAVNSIGVDCVTDKSYSHDMVAFLNKITFYGNSLAFGNCIYANRKNVAENIPNKTDTIANVNILYDGHFVKMNGSPSSTRNTYLLSSVAEEQNGFDRGRYKLFVKINKGNSTLQIDNRKLRFSFTDSEDNIIVANDTIQNIDSGTYIYDFIANANVVRTVIQFGFVQGDVFDDFVLWYGIYPEDTVFTDTGYVVLNEETYEYDVSCTNCTIDTGMHKSILDYIGNTKQYIDEKTRLPFITPEDFGAIGDGVSDDTTALQNCVDYAIDTMNCTVAVRANRTYKISSSLIIQAREIDFYINQLNYTGNDAAIIIIGLLNKIVINRVNATGTMAVGIKCTTSATKRNGKYGTDYFMNNKISVGYINANGDALLLTPDQATPEYPMHYNTFDTTLMVSNHGNCIAFYSNDNANENDFFGKSVQAPEGYFLYIPTNNGYSGDGNRFHYFSIESDVKNGVKGCAFLCDVRTRELIDKRKNGEDEGWLFDFTGVNPYGAILGTYGSIDMAAIKYKNALSFDDVLSVVKHRFEIGYNKLAWKPLHAYSKQYVVFENAQASHIDDTGKRYYLPTGKAFVYYNHIAYKPLADWYHVVNTSVFTIDFDSIDLTTKTNYIAPTIFDIQETTQIYLDFSYCIFGINSIKIIQHNGKTARVYDKFGTLIFDGTNLGEGTFALKCSFVPLQSLSVTLTDGTIHTLDAADTTRLYTGANETWTVN